MIIVGTLAIVASGILEPNNIAVLFELGKRYQRLASWHSCHCDNDRNPMSTATMTHGAPTLERKPPPIAEICVAVLITMVVARWTVLAEGIVAGLLEYVFIYDRICGPVLLLMSSTLIIFVLDLFVLFGFSLARYQDD